MQDRAGEHRQQGNRAAKQDSQEVEQDRAQQDLGSKDEPQSLERALDRRGLARGLARAEQICGRPTESHRDSGAHRQGEIGPHLGRSRRGNERQADRDGGTEQQRSGEDQPPRHSIGQLTGGKRQHEERNELGETDPPEVQGAAMQCVHLPPDSHLEHLQTDAHPEQRQPPETEVALLERGSEASQARPVAWIIDE
jgi:hypothetical protein